MEHIAFTPNTETFLRRTAATATDGALTCVEGTSAVLGGKKVMIDGHNLALEKGTGVATYARNLTYSLRNLGCEVSVLYGGRGSTRTSSLLKEVHFFDTQLRDLPGWLRAVRAATETIKAPLGYAGSEIPITGAVIRDGFKSRLPHFDRIYNSNDIFRKAHNAFSVFKRLQTVRVPTPDLAHWTYPLPLKVPGVPNVYTLHDLVPLRLPYTTLDNKKRYYRLVQEIAARADQIITVSETSKADILRFLKIEESRVTNTYQSVHIPSQYADKPTEAVQREVEGTFGLPFKEYFLFFGAIEPKKNIGRLIEGYLGANLDTPLVIVGAQAWKSEQELRLLYEDHVRSLVTVGSETRVKRKVIQLAYAPFPLLVSLIRGAKATVFPSLYEGFGLPVLESMLLGTPVLTSSVSSIPEITGDAALLVDPYDSRAIGKGMMELDQDDALREYLSAKGRLRAEVFSIARYEERLLKCYARFT
jgi:glycosyltransferase involved in cell wall biosynthesis